jgi:hypothetical protein
MPPVDFHRIRFRFYVRRPSGKVSSHICPINTGVVNAFNDFTFTCIGPWYSRSGRYQVLGATEYDVKDDGKHWFAWSSGTMEGAL